MHRARGKYWPKRFSCRWILTYAGSSAAINSEGIDIGNLIPGLAVAQVVVSRNSGYAPGEYVLGEWGWQEHSVSDGKAWIKLDPNANELSAKLGVLGLPGLTAYFGLLNICLPKPGETVVISGAAGAVGLAVRLPRR